MTEPFDSQVDDHVASSRAGKSDGRDDTLDGSYVGESSPDDALDTEESGAEARSVRGE